MNVLDILLGPVTSLIEKYIPSAQDKAQAQLELIKLQQTADFQQLDAQLKLAQAQTDIDKTEATTDKFRGGWRPFIGWVCGVALAYDFIARPLLAWVTGLEWPKSPLPPELDLGTLIPLLAGILGLGTLRTTERINGVITKGK